jgi:hypothetical protein
MWDGPRARRAGVRLLSRSRHPGRRPRKVRSPSDAPLRWPGRERFASPARSGVSAAAGDRPVAPVSGVPGPLRRGAASTTATTTGRTVDSFRAIAELPRAGPCPRSGRPLPRPAMKAPIATRAAGCSDGCPCGWLRHRAAALTRCRDCGARLVPIRAAMRAVIISETPREATAFHKVDHVGAAVGQVERQSQGAEPGAVAQPQQQEHDRLAHSHSDVKVAGLAAHIDVRPLRRGPEPRRAGDGVARSSSAPHACRECGARPEYANHVPESTSVSRLLDPDSTVASGAWPVASRPAPAAGDSTPAPTLELGTCGEGSGVDLVPAAPEVGPSSRLVDAR